MDFGITIININRTDIIKKYKVKEYPSLYINDTLALEGKLISTKEIVKLIKINH